jgi:ABC-type thiamin/hydroxymethylpyrimidine transport system permease subunit
VASFNANYKYFSDRTDALFYTSLWTFRYDIVMSSVLEVVCSMVYFASPYLTNQMTDYLRLKPAEGESALTYTAYWIVIMICIQDVVA